MEGSDDDYDFSGELLPCEFCEDLFPWDILIEHQSGCNPDALHFSTITEQTVVDKKSDDIDTKLYDFQDETFAEISTITKNKTKTESNSSVQSLWEELTHHGKKDIKIITKVEKEKVPQPVIKEISKNFQQDETELMVYGTSDRKQKKLDEDVKHKSLKPSNPYVLKNSDQKKEQIQPCKELHESSDDESEFIEEFWQRAEINLQKREQKHLRKLGNYF